MKSLLPTTFLCLMLATAWADAPSPSQDALKQPRALGQKAVLHVYYYAPRSLEITYVDSYLFKDEESCRNAISRALEIAAPHAGEGDLVSAKCVSMDPPQEITKPEKQPVSSKSSTL